MDKADAGPTGRVLMSFRESLKKGYEAASQDDKDLSSTARLVMFLGLISLVAIIVVVAL